MTNKVLILGSGTSTGIPIPGCECKVCQSNHFKNKRLRTSIILKIQNPNQEEELSFLIDTTPDLRQGLLNHKIKKIDACIITHTHADHLHGIDDLRPLCFGPPPKTIPLYTSQKFSEEIESRFPYIFGEQANRPQIGGGIPRLLTKKIEFSEKINRVNLHGINFEFFLLPHGHGESIGFRQGKFAYLIDCHDIPEVIVDYLKSINLELLIIDCVCRAPHRTHLNIDKSFYFIKKISPDRAGLIHMGHDIDHFELETEARKDFGEAVGPVFDNQTLTYRND